jgi:hypothetical protein
MSIGNLQVGQALVCAANFSGNAKSSQGALLGFYASVAGTASFYDDAGTGTTSPLGTALVINAGWNPFPVAFSKGLNVALTTAAGTLVYL